MSMTGDSAEALNSNHLRFEFTYRVYGLGIFSQLEAVGTAGTGPGGRDGGTDLWRPGHHPMGPVPEHHENAKRIGGLLEYRPDLCSYGAKDFGRFSIENSRRIAVEPYNGSTKTTCGQRQQLPTDQEQAVLREQREELGAFVCH